MPSAVAATAWVRTEELSVRTPDISRHPRPKFPARAARHFPTNADRTQEVSAAGNLRQPPTQSWRSQERHSGERCHLRNFIRLNSITTSASFGLNPVVRALPTHSFPFHCPTTHATFNVSPSKS